jgi:hypothetical protein
MSLNRKIVKLERERAILSLAIGLKIEDLVVIEREYAENDDYNVAEGYRLAIDDYINSGANFNCKMKPLLIYEDNDDTADY